MTSPKTLELTRYAKQSLLLGCLLCACGGKAVIDGQASSQGGDAANPCGGLDYCDCLAKPDCEPVTGDCYCPCCGDPGTCPSCVCGGGDYFGCFSSSCPGPFNFPNGTHLAFDENGCPAAPQR